MVQVNHLQSTYTRDVETRFNEMVLSAFYRFGLRFPIAEKPVCCMGCGSLNVVPIYKEDLQPKSIFTKICRECGLYLYFSSDLVIGEIEGRV
jgi:hypothetical protein